MRKFSRRNKQVYISLIKPKSNTMGHGRRTKAQSKMDHHYWAWALLRRLLYGIKTHAFREILRVVARALHELSLR